MISFLNENNSRAKLTLIFKKFSQWAACQVAKCKCESKKMGQLEFSYYWKAIQKNPTALEESRWMQSVHRLKNTLEVKFIFWY